MYFPGLKVKGITRILSDKSGWKIYMQYDSKFEKLHDLGYIHHVYTHTYI